ncbi:MAG TPA: MdtA/MuxA family multidrug efflux RND transporter periplasmic adaptor subunit [Candidatus Acidoferrum sp.]|nr:MdtA/MuxA family multidrug efflux RND transporter periplasmic adaptor subunit [Candidatus Acidoferrum sp.]
MAVPEPTTTHTVYGNDGIGIKELPAPPEQKLLPPPTRKRSWRGLLFLIALAIGGYYGHRYYQDRQAAKAAADRQQADRAARRSVPVAGIAARRGDLPVYLRGLGTVTAYNTVNVKSRVDGPIVAVNFTEGQNVAQGQQLLEIDPRPYQVMLQQAQGNLARDEAQLKDAQTNLARYQALWQAQVIAKQQLDTQGSQVGQFEGVIAVDKANIANAELNLSFTKIAAPIAGRIGLRQVDIGNIVHAGDANPLAVITQVQPISVLFTITADNLPPVQAKLRAGARLEVDAYDRADRVRIASGTLETPDNQIDPSTGTSRLKAVFQNEDAVLFPQQFVNARLLLEVHRGVIIIPAAAVQRGPNGPYVYVVQNGAAVMRPVTTGITEAANIEVTKGLNAGEMVITDGQDKLQEGSKVELRPASATGAAPADANTPVNTPVNTPTNTGQDEGRRGGGRRGR